MCDLLYFDALIGYPIRSVIRTVKDEAVIDRISFRAGNEGGLSRRFALRLAVNCQRSSRRSVWPHSLPSACHGLTASSTENPRDGFASKRPSSVYGTHFQRNRPL